MVLFKLIIVEWMLVTLKHEKFTRENIYLLTRGLLPSLSSFLFLSVCSINPSALSLSLSLSISISVESFNWADLLPPSFLPAPLTWGNNWHNCKWSKSYLCQALVSRTNLLEDRQLCLCHTHGEYWNSCTTLFCADKKINSHPTWTTHYGYSVMLIHAYTHNAAGSGFQNAHLLVSRHRYCMQ